MQQIYQKALKEYLELCEFVLKRYAGLISKSKTEDKKFFINARKRRVQWYMQRIHWLRKKAFSLDGLEDEGLACPYCGTLHGFDSIGCCGESSCHFEYMYSDLDGEQYLNSDLDDLYGFSH